MPNSFRSAASDPPLADTRPDQCVLLTRDRLFEFSGKEVPTWVDNLVVRLVWPTAAELRNDPRRVPPPTFINIMGCSGTTAWITNVTHQGDGGGASRAMDPFQLGMLYYAGAPPVLA